MWWIRLTHNYFFKIYKPLRILESWRTIIVIKRPEEWKEREEVGNGDIVKVLLLTQCSCAMRCGVTPPVTQVILNSEYKKKAFTDGSRLTESPVPKTYQNFTTQKIERNIWGENFYLTFEIPKSDSPDQTFLIPTGI